MTTTEKKEQATPAEREQMTERSRGGGDVSCKAPEVTQEPDTERPGSDDARRPLPKTKG